MVKKEIRMLIAPFRVKGSKQNVFKGKKKKKKIQKERNRVILLRDWVLIIMNIDTVHDIMTVMKLLIVRYICMCKSEGCNIYYNPFPVRVWYHAAGVQLNARRYIYIRVYVLYPWHPVHKFCFFYACRHDSDTSEECIMDVCRYILLV